MHPPRCLPALTLWQGSGITTTPSGPAHPRGPSSPWCLAVPPLLGGQGLRTPGTRHSSDPLREPQGTGGQRASRASSGQHWGVPNVAHEKRPSDHSEDHPPLSTGEGVPVMLILVLQGHGPAVP